MMQPNHFSLEKITVRTEQSVLNNLENQLQCTVKFVCKAIKGFYFALIVFITAENMSCIHIRQYVSGFVENSACTFHIRWNESVKFQGQK